MIHRCLLCQTGSRAKRRAAGRTFALSALCLLAASGTHWAAPRSESNLDAWVRTRDGWERPVWRNRPAAVDRAIHPAYFALFVGATSVLALWVFPSSTARDTSRDERSQRPLAADSPGD